MRKTALKLEKRYLLISVLGNAVVGCVGIVAAALSSSQAILLDGLFNVAYLAAGLFTLKVASLLAGGDDERFPFGYASFEPLVNGIKGLLVLGVTVMAFFGAIQALFTGGRAIAAGIAIGYGTFATIACWVVAWLTKNGVEKTGSPLVRADAENWIVNAAVSSCVLLAFVGIFVLHWLGLESLAPYVDPIVVLTVVVISISVPIRMAWKALMELLNRAPTAEVLEEVKGIVDANLSKLPVLERFVRVVQPGRQRMVLVHVVLPPDYRPDGFGPLDAVRSKTAQALAKAHAGTVVDIVFTANREWGAPLSDGGAG
jgi:cation diffusion facilitator family transporter